MALIPSVTIFLSFSDHFQSFGSLFLLIALVLNYVSLENWKVKHENPALCAHHKCQKPIESQFFLFS